MGERRSFDPVGRLCSAACLLLVAALAINLAVSLIQDVWTWLVAAVALGGAVVLLVRMAVWWQRRRWW